jgi:mRNA interferase MazF
VPHPINKRMGIQYPPQVGSVLRCDFTAAEKSSTRGFSPPEMIKRRPVIVLATPSPRLCIVVPTSTTEPKSLKPFHYRIKWDPLLPKPYNTSKYSWVKGDHIYTVSFDRLDLLRITRDQSGKRIYDYRTLAPDQMEKIQAAVRAGLGWSSP